MNNKAILHRRGSKQDLITAGVPTGEIVYALDTREHGWMAKDVLVWRNLDDLLTGKREPDSSIGSELDEYLQYPQLPQKTTEKYTLYPMGMYGSRTNSYSGKVTWEGELLYTNNDYMLMEESDQELDKLFPELGAIQPSMYLDFTLMIMGEFENVGEANAKGEVQAILGLKPSDRSQKITGVKIKDLYFDLNKNYSSFKYFNIIDMIFLEGDLPAENLSQAVLQELTLDIGVGLSGEHMTKYVDLFTELQATGKIEIEIEIEQRYDFQEWVKLEGVWQKKIIAPVVTDNSQITDNMIINDQNGTLYYTI